MLSPWSSLASSATSAMTQRPVTQRWAPGTASPWPRFTRKRPSSQGLVSNPGHCRLPGTSVPLREGGHPSSFVQPGPATPSRSIVWCLTPPRPPSLSFNVPQTSYLPSFRLALPSILGELSVGIRCELPLSWALLTMELRT